MIIIKWFILWYIVGFISCLIAEKIEKNIEKDYNPGTIGDILGYSLLGPLATIFIFFYLLCALKDSKKISNFLNRKLNI